ncbi:SIS domain-containing protein [Kurthia sp. FSL E2-0154]|uniref:SIS domain-containing protein n=1 Tax=Kurthia sp. FSL E2-0154 TaxID=2921358 RepID=UPI0030FBDBF1
MIYQSIEQGGILQLFGCGHSQLIAQGAYYRAGGLVPAKAVYIEPLMLHKGAAISSENEKDLSRIEEYWPHFEFQSHDVLIVISKRGKNAVPIEIDLGAKRFALWSSINSCRYYLVK